MSTSSLAEPIIKVKSLTRHFGGVVAVKDADLVVRTGSITGLIGPNGAGKTTLFSLVAGSIAPSSGEIWIDGQAGHRSPAHKRIGMGLARTFQIPKPFSGMSVLENVLVAFQNHPGENLLCNWFTPGRSTRVEKENLEKAHELIKFVALGHLVHEPARVLSGGQRKLLELARVLAANPRVILLDEPAAGVNPSLLETIIERIQLLNERGVSFLLTEHNMDMVSRLCSHVYAMARGEMLCEGSVAEVTQNPVVLEAYLGGGA